MYDKCKLCFYLGYKCVQFYAFTLIIQKQHLAFVSLLPVSDSAVKHCKITCCNSRNTLLSLGHQSLTWLHFQKQS